jgi:hypothetical protein
MYCLDGHEYNDQVSALLDLFMQAGAVGMPTSIPFVPPPAFGRQLYLLRQHNVVNHLSIPGVDGVDASTWVLTRQGASRVKATFHVEMGSPILQIRDLPLKELTTFEKFMKLADAGWQWKPQPGPALCLQLLPARLDDNGLSENKTLYTGKDVLDLYLECLLSSDQLMDVGITFVPHGQK